MKNRGLIATIVVLSAIIVALIVVLLAMQLSSIVPLNINKNQQTETEIAVETETSIIQSIEETSETAILPKINADIKTYTSNGDRINIDYPVISGLDNSDMEKTINDTLYNNAISIVKLYPISTALQRLSISCEVKYLGDDYITVLYEGRVVGDKAGGANTNLKNSATITNNTPKNSNTVDPYLDGFVDPLSAFPATVTPQQNLTPIEIHDNNNAVNQVPSNDKTKTADHGPTVAPAITPTAERNRRNDTVTGNSANSNPSAIINNQYSSNGIYQSGSGAPVTSSGNANSSNAPVYGYTSTNTSISASTIDQKIFYTNTIDLNTGKSLTLKDYIDDFEKLAKYARSRDVEIINVTENNKSEVRRYINKTVLPTLTEQLEKNSDFQNDNMKVWPKHFSYRDPDGTIYFTIKLSSRLGNYAIIKYNK